MLEFVGALKKHWRNQKHVCFSNYTSSSNNEIPSINTLFAYNITLFWPQ